MFGEVHERLRTGAGSLAFVWRSSPLLRLTTSAAPVDMLTLSGGGAECAYGAGFLAGWSDSGSRPRSAPRPRWQPYRVGQSNQL